MQGCRHQRDLHIRASQFGVRQCRHSLVRIHVKNFVEFSDLKGGGAVAARCMCVRRGDSMCSKPGRRSTPTTNGTREHKMQKRLEAVCEIKVCYFIRRKCSNLEHQECVHVLGLDFPPLHHGWRGRLQELGWDLSARNWFGVRWK